MHGAYIDELEIGRIVSHIKSQGLPAYDETITRSEEEALGLENSGGEHDELFEEALRICETLVRSNALDVIVLDSVAALITKAELEGEIGDSTVGAQARLMSAAMRKLIHLAYGVLRSGRPYDPNYHRA